MELTAIDLFCMIDIHKSLNDVSMWAYEQDCCGLTQDECRTLENLCDKAMREMEKQIGRTFQLKTIDE